MNQVWLYAGSIIITLWGIAHLFPTKSIITGLGSISIENKRIFAMAWIAEGIAMISIGALVLLINILGYTAESVARFIYGYFAIVLFLMAILSFFTGFRTSIIPMKICPFIKLLTMMTLIFGSLG